MEAKLNLVINEEDKQLLKELIRQFDRFNENLDDLKTMAAPWLGFKIKKETND